MTAAPRSGGVGGRAPDPRVHGGDGARIAASLGLDPGDVLDLSASLNPVAPDPSAVVARHLDALGRYPDPAAAAAALAGVMGVPVDEVLLTNGGAEAISLVAAELGGSVVEPDFSLYPRGGGPVWRSNPNNPLGELAPADAEAGVWDEAFWPLATGSWTRGDHRRGAVVVGSLTKLLACPGLRVGYVLSGDADLLGRLRAAQPEWSVNGLVCSALPELLAPVDLAAWRDHVVDLRAGLADLFRGAGFTVRDTAGPWVLVDGASWLRDALIAQRVVTRDCTSFGMPGTLRVAVPRPTDLPNLRAALAAATAER